MRRKLGWIAFVAVGWLVLQLLPKQPAHHPPRPHHTRGPGSDWLDRQLESLRLWGKETFYDPALKREQARHRRKHPAPAVLADSPVKFTLGPKRILAARGDADVPPHAKYNALADFKQFKVAMGEEPPESTTVFYLLTIAPAGKPFKAALGKLALRDAGGKALFVDEWHFPQTDVGRMRPHHGLLAQVRRRDDHPRFRELLYTPESDVTLEFSPYFVCYEDGTMAGDAHAFKAIDGEGTPVETTLNGLAWVVHQQYPDEIPNATINTIYR